MKKNMKFNPEGYKQARWMFLTLIAMTWGLGFMFIQGAMKTREDYSVITGKVIEQGNTSFAGIKQGVTNYAYYFELSNHNKPFGVGTNKDWKPILDESFKGLKEGDLIKVTFEENWATGNGPINQMVREIVRGNEILYQSIHGTIWNGAMKLGLACIFIGVCVLALLLVFNRKYKRLTTTDKKT